MSLNLNYTHKNEINLNAKLIDECIRMYGVECKLVLVDKANIDPTVFGDWSNFSAEYADTFLIHLLPENGDDLDRTYSFGDFGFNDFSTSTVFMSAIEFNSCKLDIKTLQSSLVIFPSNRVLEITDVEHQVPGINHLWSYSDAKSAYKLTLRTYEFKLHDDIGGKAMFTTDLKEFVDIENPENELNEKIQEYDSLDNYFETLVNEKDNLEYESEIKESTIVNPENIEKPNEVTRKPIIVNGEKDPFGW